MNLVELIERVVLPEAPERSVMLVTFSVAEGGPGEDEIVVMTAILPTNPLRLVRVTLDEFEPPAANATLVGFAEIEKSGPVRGAAVTDDGLLVG